MHVLSIEMATVALLILLKQLSLTSNLFIYPVIINCNGWVDSKSVLLSRLMRVGVEKARNARLESDN